MPVGVGHDFPFIWNGTSNQVDFTRQPKIIRNKKPLAERQPPLSETVFQ
jgi:hypothetical protein